METATAIDVMEESRVYSPQEERILRGDTRTLTTDEGKTQRPRVNRLLKSISRTPARLSIDRARWFTESFKETGHFPLTLRWAMAIDNICKKINVYIGPDELIVGRGGPIGRYGILYPELEGAYFAQMKEILPKEKGRPYIFEEEDIKILKEEIVPYWVGKTFLEALTEVLPEETKLLFKKEGDPYNPTFVLHETSSVVHSLQWFLDYDKVLKRGFNGIKREAEERIKSLDVMDPKNNYDKLFFYKAAVVVCDAAMTLSKRYADLARSMAKKEKNAQRKKELLEIAEVCEWVPGNPARTFREAVQSQWFAQVVSRFEQIHAGNIGNGRIDQYLYPYYKKDIEEGRLTDNAVMELLECLWLNMAQSVRVSPSPAGFKVYAGDAHYEHTTIGGQLRDGRDATNELSYLILQSKIDFPLDFPDLSVRIHSRTPQRLLLKACELAKQGTGFPKFMNDEEIIPLLLVKGATLEEARDYGGSGCTEVRLVNKSTYFSRTSMLNMGAVLEMALNDGKMRWSGGKRLGVSTGDPRKFTTWDDMWNAFRLQLENAQKHIFIQQYITDLIRPNKLAAPLLSCLHDLCMKAGKDINDGKIEGGMSLGGQTNGIGFGTVIDSLSAIRKLVYDDKTLTMDQMLEALDKNFEGKEAIRQLCLNAPKYGNCDPYVDSLGKEIETVMLRMHDKHTNAYGGQPELFYVPVSIHVPCGKVVGATPNGRMAGKPLSEGISPTQGADTKGPTATLLSIDATKASQYIRRGARLLNMKLSPQVMAGEEGLKNVASLIRAWCDQKHWHLQLNVVNRATLIAAQKDPEMYKNLLVRVAGYSAYFVDLSPDLQNEIIARTEHQFI